MSKTQEILRNIDSVFERYSNGESLPTIAKDFNCNSGLIWSILNKNGYKLKQHQTDPQYLQEVIPQIIDLYKNGLSAYKLERQFKLNTKIVLDILNKAGFDTSLKKKGRADRLVDHKQEIIDLYNSGIGAYTIGKMFKAPENNIAKLLKKNGVVIRPLNTYDVDLDFFKKIDSPEKSYLLGFWYADGNVVKRGIRIALQEEDGYILDRFKEIMKYTGSTTFSQRSLKNPKYKDQRILSISRSELSQQLVKLGCVPNKSLILEFPTENQVPDRLLSHFIRGYFDGDGSISMSKQRNTFCFVGIISSSIFINKLNEILINKLDLETKIYVCPNPKTSNLRISKKEHAKKFLQWIYQDSTIHLTRKYEKAKSLLLI